LHVEIEKGKKNPEKNGVNTKKGDNREQKREEKRLINHRQTLPIRKVKEIF
jgi:hypothetical protein